MFGAKFVAMKVRVKTFYAIQYKLRMMGIPISGPSYIHGDNMSVILNTSKTESTLKKKFNTIAYHAVNESMVMRKSLTGHVNPANMLTKVITRQKRKHFASLVLCDIVI